MAVREFFAVNPAASSAKKYLVDVRTPAEINSGIPLLKPEQLITLLLVEWGTDFVTNCEQKILKHLNLTTTATATPSPFQQLQQVRRDSHIALLCRSGVRSHHAAESLVLAGWSNVYNIAGGLYGEGGWVESSFPITVQPPPG